MHQRIRRCARRELEFSLFPIYPSCPHNPVDLTNAVARERLLYGLRSNTADNSTRAIERWLAASPVRKHGAFVDGCARHCDDGERQIDPIEMRVNHTNPLQAFDAWYAALSDAKKARRVWKQPGTYPCRTCCGPVLAAAPAEAPALKWRPSRVTRPH